MRSVICLKMNVNDTHRLVDIWLTVAERNDPHIHECLKHVYQAYRQKKYLVAVFESGDNDLYHSTQNLLTYNKRRCAEISARCEKNPQFTRRRM